MAGNGTPLDLDRLPDLPLRPRLAEAAALLHERGTMVLRAEPSSGKTTLLPLGILAGSPQANGVIVMLEPRRVAAVQAAARIAELLGERAGQTAGYAVRGESSRGPMTRILCVTDGLFLRMVQGDPGLEGIGTVILDEFHERSANADLSLAFCLEARASLRPDLRIALMSATLDAEALAAWLSMASGAEAGLLSVPGAPYPVEISYAPVNPRGRNDDEIAQRVIETAARADGDVLVFLPGLREMEGVARGMPAGAAAPEVFLLHGSLPLEEQRRIVAGRTGGTKGTQRIILSTSLAQSSLTVPGVRAVVDAGLTRLTRYDPSSGLDALVTERVSRRDADQRAGRAGRLGPGACLRLWAESETLNEATSPEIQRIDLAPFLLECAVWGSAPDALSLPDPPPKAVLSRAQGLLQNLELIDAKGRATDKGKACAALGAGPRLGSMLIARPDALSCACAALLSDRDRSGIRGDADIRHRLASLRDGDGVSRSWIERMRQDFSRFADSCGLRGDQRLPSDLGEAGDALALAFPDRICKREGEAYRFPSGKTARLAAPSGTHAGALQGEEWLVAVEADPGEGVGLIRAAAPLSVGFVEKTIVPRAETGLEIEWKCLAPRLRAQALYGKIRLSASLSPPDGSRLRELVAASFAERLGSEGLGILPWTDGAREFLERARFYLGAREPGRAELLSEGGLGSTLADWLIPRCAFPAVFREGFYPPILDEAGLRAALASRIAPFRAAMDREAPEHIVLPSGRSAKVIYAAGAVPAVEGKVQEFFGLAAHPKAAGQPLAIRLLSPAQRPVQITRDIAGFWKNSYPEVRKELRGRYPKHEWPEDGAAALPSRGPKKKARLAPSGRRHYTVGMENEYDVAIVGAGLSGASVARRLSAYELKVVLLEREADVSFGVSKANSGIVHGGFHHEPGSLKARLEVAGALMFDRLKDELDFPFARCGLVVAAFHEEEMRAVQSLYERGRANGAIGLEVLSRERLLDLEPLIHPDAVGGLLAPAGGIVEPYRFAFALVESAVKNGVELKKDFELVSAKREGDAWALASANGEKLRARFAVNAAGLYADEVSQIFGGERFRIRGRKGQYYILDRMTKARPSRVVFPAPSAVSKGMLVIPTVEKTVLIGPSASWGNSKDDLDTDQEALDRVTDSARRMVPAVSANDIIASFAGLRPVLDEWLDEATPAPAKDDFYIAMSAKAPGLLQLAGIQSPGLTASPAIGEYVKDLLRSAGLSLTEKASYDPRLARRKRLRDASSSEAEAMVAADPRYGNIVCRCERVSEAEIVQAVALGHRTLDGVKYFTRAQMGRCQGGFCAYKIIKIIMRETGLPWDRVTKRGEGSRVLGGEL